MNNDVVTIHVSKLYNSAKQFSLPGKEAQWVAKRLADLLRAGKLVGFTQSPSGDWVKINVKEIPTKLIIRGVNNNTAAEISSAFWRELSRS